jgi:NAD(P)-dependent dehydrogenase (short-subunit alcohol dehydrogenase family)
MTTSRNASSASLLSLPNGYRAAVFGASGGLGSAFVAALDADERCAVIHAGMRGASGHDVGTSPKVRTFQFDLENESSIEAGAAACTRDGPLHLVLVTTGMLHGPGLRPEKTWRSLSAAALGRAFAINAIGPALVAKHVLASLATRDKAVFAVLSARVGSIADNRLGGWHAYRASKAALNMLVRTFAIELTARNATALCIALHPGTVDTALSRPFQAGVKPGSLFTATHSVQCLMRVIDQLEAAQSGRLFAWDGSEIPS